MTSLRGGRLSFDLGGVLTPPLAKRDGLTAAEIKRQARGLARVLPELLGPKAPSGFAKLPGRRKALEATVREARRLRRMNLRDWVHIGIGGSALGTETLFKALAHPFHNELPDSRRSGPRIHVVDNVDPDRVGALLDHIDLARTGVHVVSKSGGTVETLAALQVVREAFEARRRGPRWADRCVVTTGRGALAELAAGVGLRILDFPEDVGGRFSALTPSGLLTPAVAGVRVSDVVDGARSYLAGLRKRAMSENAPALAACAGYALAESGKNVHVLMPYADALEPLARWYVQLFAESLGKRAAGGRRGVGPTPVPGRGTTDQHAQVQLFMEGPRDKLVTFVEVESGWRRLVLPGGEPGEYLEGVSMTALLRAEMRGTSIALARAGRPSATWRLPELSGAHLGALLLAFELQVAYQAKLYGIDAYDQPGVEAGKVAAYALIGREGYEKERAGIESTPAPSWKV